MNCFEHKFWGFSRTMRSVTGLSHFCLIAQAVTSRQLWHNWWVNQEEIEPYPLLEWLSLDLQRSEARSASLDVLHSSALLLSHQTAQERLKHLCGAMPALQPPSHPVGGFRQPMENGLQFSSSYSQPMAWIWASTVNQRRSLIFLI